MTQLQKRLTLYGLTMIAVGGSIGSGIFLTPSEIATILQHPTLVLLVWMLGGVIALTGALTFAELGAMFPKSGGVYVFLKEAYGKRAGFLYGWIILLVINTGALAALGMALAEYITIFVPLSENGKILFAIAIITGLTAINCVGVNVSQLFANVFTGLKLLAMLAIIVVGFLFYDPDKVQLNFSLVSGVPDHWASAMLVALIGVLWSFGGWHHASYLAGETVDAQRTAPRAMMLGALIVTAVYVLINLAYMLLLPMSAMAQTSKVAGDAIASVFSFGGQLVAIAIAISVFGTIGIYTMSAPRIYFAMAEDGIFFKKLSWVHPRFHTPVYAMAAQAIWAILLLLFWRTFSNLITYVTFMDIVFMTMAGYSIFIFRRRLPDMPRPYRTLGYPVVPLIFTGISAAFVVNTLFEKPEQALAGLILLGLGIAAYQGFRRKL